MCMSMGEHVQEKPYVRTETQTSYLTYKRALPQAETVTQSHTRTHNAGQALLSHRK